jgi:hypothetical protein
VKPAQPDRAELNQVVDQYKEILSSYFEKKVDDGRELIQYVDSKRREATNREEVKEPPGLLMTQQLDKGLMMNN